MKILRITLSNLNSLRGDHVIDLEGDPLGSAGIFAITGPTGAGKSTLLDAITLALYGRAARYGSSPNPEHMMSRHTGKCAASVTFEVPTGRFTAEWQLRRARGKPDGSIQPAKRYLYDAARTVLAEQITKCDEKIELLCGLDYDRFMRSVLLAQGEFARFLKAKANERAELLESLTGTAIYSELGTLAHQEIARRRLELETKRVHQSTTVLLTDEERRQRQSTIEQLDRQHTENRKAIEKLNAVLSNSEDLQRQLQRVTDLQSLRDRVRQQREESTERWQQLDLHQSALPFFAALGRLDDAEDLHRQRILSRDQADEELRTAKQQQAAAVESVVQMADSLLKQKKELQSERQQQVRKFERVKLTAETWLEERSADQRLNAAFPAIVEKLNDLRNIRREKSVEIEDSAEVHRQLNDENQRLQQTQEKLATARRSLKTKTDRFRQVEQELQALLDGTNLKDLQICLDQLKDRQRDVRDLQRLLGRRQQIMERSAEFGKTIQNLEKRFEHEHTSLTTAAKQEDSLRQILQAHREHLTTARLVASLEEHRAQLVDGQMCPLCGATEHPYVSGADVPPQVQSIQKKIDSVELDLRTATASLEVARRTAEGTKTELAAERQRLIDASAEITGLDSQIESQRTTLGISDVAPAVIQDAQEAVDGELQALEERLRNTEASQQLVQQARASMQEADLSVKESTKLEEIGRSEIQRRKERMETLEERIEKIDARLMKLESQVMTQLAPFEVTLPGDGEEEATRSSLDRRRRDYDDRVQKRQQAENAIRDSANLLQQAEQDVVEISDSLTRLLQRRESLGRSGKLSKLPEDKGRPQWISLEAAEETLNQLEARVAVSQERLTERASATEGARSQVERVKQELQEVLTGSTFRSLDLLRLAKLPESQVIELTQLKTQLDDQEKNLAGQLQSVQETVDRLRALRTAEGMELETLRSEKSGMESTLNSLIGQRATLVDEMRRDDDNRQKLLENEESLKRETEAIKVWELLGGLIGSADGGRFRRFAQGISLDVLVRHANRHLERLSDRYQLHRVEGQELDLAIVDLFQAGVSRPMSSLSGGESFLASLALALGLSDLAGRNVQINSLFIDEGFGTLDPETLDIALSALDVLRLSNKTIGVISHVALLKERITTQISVTKLPGGVSELTVSP